MRLSARTFIAAFSGIALVLAAGLPALGADAYTTQGAGEGYSVASVEESGNIGGVQRSAYANIVSSGQFESWLCPNGVDNDKCKADAPNVQYQSRQQLMPCADAASENCIESLNLIASDGTRCGVAVDFAPETRIRLKARVSTEIAGWFRGRITKSDISISKFSATNNLISVEANTGEVARMRAVVSPTNSTPEQQQAIISHGGNGGNTVFHNEIKSPFSNWGEFSWVEMFRGLAKDTAAGVSTVWGFSTIDGQSQNKCMADSSRVLGVVSTNAPISATISVIGDGGVEKTAVTTVNEKDGWIHLAAYGFTFSSPTVNVKLTQEGSATASTPTGTPAVKTITCVKGKVSKKVAGASPKCPAGFKKK